MLQGPGDPSTAELCKMAPGDLPEGVSRVTDRKQEVLPIGC